MATTIPMMRMMGNQTTTDRALLARFIILGDPPTLNQYIEIERGRAGRFRAAKEKRTWTGAVALQAATQAAEQGITVIDCPVAIHLDWYAPNKRSDPDNVRARIKFVLDGLVTAGVLKNDSWRYVREFHDRFFVDKDNPRLEMEIYGWSEPAK